jgi:hypothetical protein
MKNLTFKISLLLLSLSVLFINYCEDPVPTDFKEEIIVEAYLLVGQPIENILIRRTIPISDSIEYAKSIIRDAKVKIIGNNREFNLTIDNDTTLGYYFSDKTYLVKENTKYNLEIEFADGSIVKAETTTPLPTEWIKKSNGTLQYPLDSIKLPASDTIAWIPIDGQSFYMLSVKCLDTLEYGKYLTPPTEEKNRRPFRPFGGNNEIKELTNFAFIPNTKTTVVWNTFRFFGKHEVAIYTVDWNMTRWFIQVQASRDYSPLLGSIEGKAIGVFGSAAGIKDTFMLLKNQP